MIEAHTLISHTNCIFAEKVCQKLRVEVFGRLFPLHHRMFAHVCVCVGREVLLLAEKFQRHKPKENAFALKKKKKKMSTNF